MIGGLIGRLAAVIGRTWRFVAVGTLAFVLFAAWVLAVPEGEPLELPEGKSFAFAIVDDTDASETADILPVYELLMNRGIRVTKTVWAKPGGDTIWANSGASLEDSVYRAFVSRLSDSGVEIASHGARGGDSRRGEVLDAMDELRKVTGRYPRVHINHYQNRDNVYWGGARFAVPPLGWVYDRASGTPSSFGHDAESEWFWADFLAEHVDYVRNFTFSDINVMNVAPSIPYHLPEKPHVKYWFHASDGGDVSTFVDLLSTESLDRLEEERGVAIVFTHFASGFTSDGVVDPVFRQRIEDLAGRDGWFVTVSELLDYLRSQGRGGEIGLREKIRIETLWVWDKVARRLR